MSFGFDPAKAAPNLAKHGVRFEDAVLVFADPLHRSIYDQRDGGEERWQTMGMAGGLVLLLVAHTWRMSSLAEGGEVIRIISARRATKQERRDYEQG